MKCNFSILGLSFLSVAAASPVVNEKRDHAGVDENVYESLLFMSQYAGASYCSDLVNPTKVGQRIKCTPNKGSCPLVEADRPWITAAFNNLGALSDVSGFIAIDDTRKSIVISFQGSVGFQDILAIDANADRDSTDLCKGQPTTNILDRCGVHSGFMGQWEVAQMFVVESLAKAYKSHPSYQVVVTGHSMGGAVAAIAATYLRNLGYNVNLFTYGQPRIGGRDISYYITHQAPSKGLNFRVTHKGDVIPQLPSHLQLLDDYDHFTPEYYINVAGLGSVSAADIDVITTELFSPGSGNSHEDADLSTVSDEDTHPQYFAKITACDSGPSFDFGADTSYVDHPIDQTTPSATTMPSSEPSSAIDLPEEPTPESTTVVDVPIANSSTEEPTPEPTTIVDIPIENSSTVESGPTATLKPTMSFPTNTNGPSTISATGLIRPTSTASIPYLNSTISSRLSVLASTTSTAWKTTVYTVTSCAPTVTNCPAKVGHLTTETVIDYVTVCPVTASTSSTGPITTAVVYTSTTICPVTETHVSGGITSKIVTSSTPTILVTSILSVCTDCANKFTSVTSAASVSAISSTLPRGTGTGIVVKPSSTSLVVLTNSASRPDILAGLAPVAFAIAALASV